MRTRLARVGIVGFVLTVAVAVLPGERAGAVTEPAPPVEAAPAAPAVVTDHAVVDGRYIGCDTGYGDTSHTATSLAISE